MQNIRLNIIISIFAITFIAGFLIGMLFHWGNPYVMVNRSDTFNDFYATLAVIKDPYSAIGFARGYFPFIYVFLWLFSSLSMQGALILSLVSFIIFFYVSSYIFLGKKTSMISPCLVLCSFSYAFIFMLERANVEIFIYMFIALFVMVYFSKCKCFSPLVRDILAALFLSFAITTKLYPAVFFVLMVRDKRFRCLILSVLSSITIGIAGMMAINGTISGLINNLSWFSDNYDMSLFSMILHDWTHSIFSVIKSFVMLKVGNESAVSIIQNISIFYAVFMLLLFVIISVYVVLYEESNWKTLYLIIAAMILFPFTSHDYTLAYLFIPMLMFIISDEVNGKLDIVYSVLFAIPLCFLNWLQLIPSFTWYHGIIIRPSLIVVMMLIIMTQGVKARRFKEQFLLYLTK